MRHGGFDTTTRSARASKLFRLGRTPGGLQIRLQPGLVLDIDEKANGTWIRHHVAEFFRRSRTRETRDEESVVQG